MTPEVSAETLLAAWSSEGDEESQGRFYFNERSYCPVGDAAGDDPVEVAKIRGDV